MMQHCLVVAQKLSPNAPGGRTLVPILDERHPAFRYDLDRITITGDGTIWLQTTYQRSDNQAHPAGAFMWALGRPGSVAVGDGLPGDIVPLPDDSMLAIGDDVVRFDGTAVVPDASSFAPGKVTPLTTPR